MGGYNDRGSGRTGSRSLEADPDPGGGLAAQSSVHGSDLDPDELTAFLRDLADAIDEREAKLVSVSDTLYAAGYAPAEAAVRIDYQVAAERQDLLRAISIDTDGRRTSDTADSPDEAGAGFDPANPPIVDPGHNPDGRSRPGPGEPPDDDSDSGDPNGADQSGGAGAGAGAGE